jgi:AAA domain, putative AbiEii toxin, Type IV TA system
MLRGLRPVQLVNGERHIFGDNIDNYKNRTVVDYFLPGGAAQMDFHKRLSELHIISGLSLYEDIKRMLLGTITERASIRAFEIFLSRTFFDDEPVSLTPNIDKDCLFVTIGIFDRAIYDLGDGIQTIIILLYPIFLYADEDLLCFIEEPELSLHPGMQRLLIDTMMSEQFKKVQFFLTTHSNHFLDMTLDHGQISIYNFKSLISEGEPRYQIENTENKDILLLDGLGVRNSSVFTSNCTIWVEGITDRLYLNKYMEVLQQAALKGQYDAKRLKEDLHFSYIDYGGSNLTHYSFDDEDNWERIKASSISSRLLVVVDEDGINENPNLTKARKIQKLQEHLKDQLIILPCRGIENSLSITVLQAVLRELEGDKDLDLSRVKEADYKDEYLGNFIEEKLPAANKRYRETAGSGTISGKVSFCKKAIAHIKGVEDLSDAGRSVAARILDFIGENNR